MPAQGQVYNPKQIIPPGQQKHHRVVVVTNSNLAARPNLQFLMVALIRSAIQQGTNRPVGLVIGHSVPLPANSIASLPFDSIVETHQLFAIPVNEFKGLQADGKLPDNVMDDVLAGCRKIF